MVEHQAKVVFSRRRFMLNIGVLGATAGLASVALSPRRAVAGSSKLDQRSAAYQPNPKGNARCDGCVQWQGPDACKVVQGTISPNGWCVLFARGK